MSTIKALDSYLDAMAAKAAANPAKASIYQAKVDAKIAKLIAKGKTVTNDGATITSFDVDSGSSGGGSGSTGTTGQTFTLTASVDSVPGLTGSLGSAGVANNDTIQGIVGNGSSTFSLGDSINAGSGTDILNIIAISGTSTLLTSLEGVETVNIRVLDDNDASVFDAQDWSGVSQLTNASSLAESTLQVSGLADSTTVVLHGNTDINVGFDNTATGATANAVLVNAGSAGTATTVGSAAAGTTAHFDFDLANAGFVTNVNLEVRGSVNIARIEAGSNVTAVVVTGTGNASLVTDDTITSFNASAALGSLDVTFSGVSDVAAVGGAGNDTFRFGTTFSNSDSVVGGAGTDTVVVSVAGFNRTLNTTSVENATITFTEAAGGDVNASASTVTSYTFAAGTAGNNASVSQVANGATFTLNDDDLGDVTLDFASGSLSTTLNLGSVSGTVGIGTLAITDVQAVTINAVGVSGTVGGTIGTASFDSDLKALAISTSGGEADLTIGTTNVDMQLGAATSLSVTSNGSAGVTFNAVDLAGSSLATVTLSANGTDAADITLGDLSGAALTRVNISGASGADVVVGTVDLGDSASSTAQSQTISIVQGQTSDVTVGAITVSGQGTLTLNVTQNGTAVADIAAITLVKTGTADAEAKNFSLGALTVAGSGEVALNNIDVTLAGTGAQVSFGAITVSQDGGFSAGAISGTGVNIDVSEITVVVGSSASSNFAGFVGFSGGALGARTVTVQNAGSANFGGATASAIGATTIVANTGAGVDFAGMTAEQTIGAISVGGVDGADVTFGTLGASAIGAISVSGALDVTFGTITATTIGEVNNQGQGVSGTFTIDLSGVTNAVEVKLGAATNTVISGLGNDVITLTTGTTGNDNIQYTTSTQGYDQIIGFGAGTTGGDQIELFVSALAAGMSGGLRDLDGVAIGTGTVSVDLSSVVTAATATVLAADNILVLGTAMNTTAAMQTFMQTGLILGTAAIAGSGALVVAWTDGTDTMVSLVHFDVASAQGGGTTGSLASATLTTTTLTSISGVTPGAFVSANFDFQ